MEPIEQLGDGLVMRRATPADADPLAAFNALVHGSPNDPSAEIGAWTRDLLLNPHPTFGDGGYIVVEETTTGRIVSSLNLIPQTWSYAGIPFGVGRVELVGTLPEYRRRGLIRRQMDEVHRWSAALGHHVQIITGIANFYRQFGYEQGLWMGGGRAGYRHQIPSLPPGSEEPFRVRPATVDDAPFLGQLEEHARPRWLLTVPRDAALWRHEIAGIAEDSLMKRAICVIEAGPDAPRPEGERVGCLLHDRRPGTSLWTYAYELVPDLSWLAVTPSILRHLRDFGDTYVPDKPEHAGRRFERFVLQLGLDHPAYRALPWLPEAEGQYANYVRVLDVAGFVRHITPVLERRLAESVAVGHTGRLRLSFYRDGLLLTFERGGLVAVEPCSHHAGTAEAGPIAAAFPGLTFLQVLFGGRSLEELTQVLSDCRARTPEGRVLVGILFPKHPSLIWPIG